MNLFNKIRRKAAYKNVFSTDDGKIVLADIYSMCGVGKTLIGQTDSITNYNVGAYRVGQYIARLLHQDLETMECIHEEQKKQMKSQQPIIRS